MNRRQFFTRTVGAFAAAAVAPITAKMPQSTEWREWYYSKNFKSAVFTPRYYSGVMPVSDGVGYELNEFAKAMRHETAALLREYQAELESGCKAVS